VKFLGNLIKIRRAFNDIPAGIYPQLPEQWDNATQQLRYTTPGKSGVDILNDSPLELG